ncbi:MAG: MXAN_6521/LA_1396 family lipoprotein [Myxococcaceae bacterium]|nr:MXAN_6521/LA_1396 family lipoprotein [Myxococcaceae bacterium]
MARAIPVVCVLALSSACAVVKSARVSDDWEKVDRDRVKRLVIVTQPDPAGDPQVGAMWSALAARRVDLRRSFIIKDKLHLPAGQPVDCKALCTDGIEGVLWLKPEVHKQGEGVEAQLEGHLFRCVDLAEVWTATAGGSWDTRDDQLTQTIADYTDEFGPSVTPFVVASYRILHATLDTLPDPVLSEADKDDKIEYAQ